MKDDLNSTDMRNSKGVIAELYSDLQGLPALEEAAKSYITEKVSTWSLIKVMLQTVEIGVQNLNDLLSRIKSDFNKGKLSKSLIKLGWVKDINNLIVYITNLNILLYDELRPDTYKELLITDSQLELEVIYKELDSALNEYLLKKSVDVSKILQNKNLNDDMYMFLHYYRILAHELIIWNKNLKKIYIPADTEYSAFVGLASITRAVNNPSLKGDTFFKQFRCLHQIPELITIEVNDRLEFALVNIRVLKNDIACKHLKIANKLLTVTLQAFRPIINNLSHNDYHRIRENLGLTSGSHSINIHFHLFRDLYISLATEFIESYFRDEQSYQEKLNKDYLVKLVEIELLTLRHTIDQWRTLHLHLPRINLGENKTKSLIGSSEAVEAARKMQYTAYLKDPLNKLDKIYFSSATKDSGLIDYITSEKSFDNILGGYLGEITQTRFRLVQERKGVFAKPIKFNPPPKRNL